ncbi:MULTISPECIES: Xaa-Pro peptidase family protein [unclassified Chelatococcus]|uniref:M24 family metallopeptidase n=1 Tax=unclassified Chelatococcus TaxID=2638111 RepID=UPI001BCE0E85|nr:MULTISPECIES: Xaa-Pro peptidase family protein [unclassified Chelatococcus]CAH1656221.1 Xaa-Pro dipeptidase [Hyphomicrobiales bacterium]MBS7742488.1 aminopeptidase P family protein [Chelatococcus sp. HY11]MBX3542394.1 aminopeptidase P family protein [Chelatococcus sp.]MCO5075389.1 Xaa-Pro peptidase family protein [Chelatococcus sp.]CAH1695777.1 Xaa-Pro dipeptidase [Hyphomicrobiales bacterium]
MADFDLNDILQEVPQGKESVFPKDEYERRLAKLRVAMSERGFDLVLLSGPENIFYLSGQQTPGYYAFQCLCIPLEGKPFHVLRGLEAMNARLNTYLDDIIGYADDVVPASAVAEVLFARGWRGKRVAIDQSGWFLTINLYNRLVADFGPLLDATGLVEPLRRIKSALEIEQMEKAGHANEAGMSAGLAVTKVGANENDIASAIMGAAIKAGSEYVGMEPFVTSGPRSGIPHTTWRRRQIEPGDVTVLETSACYNRYHVALFRTVACGEIPQIARDMYQVCGEALEVALEKLRPGNTCADVHDAVQAVIDSHGQTNGYRKRTGYSMGISFAPDWGEGNILSLFRGIDVPLEPGMAFHVPITLRAYNKFTVAVSETVLVTDGAPRTFSSISREIVEA